MNRLLRNIVFFSLGLLLGGFCAFAFAETIPAVLDPSIPVKTIKNTDPVGTTYYETSGIIWKVVGSATHGCAAYPAGYKFYQGYTATTEVPCGWKVLIRSIDPVVGCPTGQNWTLNGSSCTRPDCVSPQVRLSNGTCTAGDCVSGTADTNFVEGDPLSAADTYCNVNNCLSKFSKATAMGYSCVYGASGFGFCKAGYNLTTIQTGGKCDYSNNTYPAQPDVKTPPDPSKNCPPGYGIASASNGFVRCLPPGTSSPTKTVIEDLDPSGVIKQTTTDDQTVTKTTCEGDTCTSTQSKVGDNGVVTNTTVTQSKDVFCENNPNNAACVKAGSGSGSGTGTNDYHFSTPTAGKFTGKTKEIEEAKAAITSELTKIRGEASNLLGKLTTGAGALPCGNGVNVLGSTFKLCVSQYSSQLQVISSAMLLIGALAALFIIFR